VVLVLERLAPLLNYQVFGNPVSLSALKLKNKTRK